MGVTTQETEFIRDVLIGLQPDSSPDHRILYESARNLYISKCEGEVPYVYNDGKDNKTVGIGFNMDQPMGRQIWNKIFDDEVSFHDVYHGKIGLTPKQIHKLLIHSLTERENFLRQTYNIAWPHLEANIRLAIESAHYNGPSLVRGQESGLTPTRFYGHIVDYAQNKNLNSLKQAIYELTERSGGKEPACVRVGLKNRRNSEAVLLASYDSPLYKRDKESN